MSPPKTLSAVHESAIEHTDGTAVYVADLPVPKGTLVGHIVCSPHAHAKIISRSGEMAQKQPGIAGVFFAHDVPGDNKIGPIVHDEPLLAEEFVEFMGQGVAFIVGENAEACRKAAAFIEVEYEPLPALLDIRKAVQADSFLTTPHRIARGDTQAALATAPIRFSGEAHNGAQNHFYLETQAAFAIPEEQGRIRILSSTQHPTEMQRMAAWVLGLPQNQII